MFAENEPMTIEAQYEDEQGNLYVKIIEVNEDANDYIQAMHTYICFLESELLAMDVSELKINWSESDPIMVN